MSTDYEAQCRGRMWGVFRRSGPKHEMPLALFYTPKEAERWRSFHNVDDYSILRADAYISYHNGPPHKDPKAEFEHFEPKKEDQ